MKQKNAIIGTKVKVKNNSTYPAYAGLVGTIVDTHSFISNSYLVQFKDTTDLTTHDGYGDTKSKVRFTNSWFFGSGNLKRIKE